MKDIYISRRDFMKMTISGCILTKVIPSVYFTNENESNNNLFSRDEKDYIVLNGWVLLKSDIALD